MTVHTTWKRAVGAAAAVTLALAVAACGSNGGGGSTTTADGRSSLVWNMWSGSTAEVEAERTLTEHHAIVDALGKGDANLAAAQATVHIDGVARRLRRATGS